MKISVHIDKFRLKAIQSVHLCYYGKLKYKIGIGYMPLPMCIFNERIQVPRFCNCICNRSFLLYLYMHR